MSTERPELTVDSMVVYCTTCDASKDRKVHKGGRLQGMGAFLLGWEFHPCDENPTRMCPDCLRAARAACERCARRNSSLAQTGGDPAYRRRRYSREAVTAPVNEQVL